MAFTNWLIIYAYLASVAPVSVLTGNNKCVGKNLRFLCSAKCSNTNIKNLDIIQTVTTARQTVQKEPGRPSRHLRQIIIGCQDNQTIQSLERQSGQLNSLRCRQIEQMSKGVRSEPRTGQTRICFQQKIYEFNHKNYY